MLKNEFTEIIEILEIKDSQLKNMRQRIIKASNNSESTNQVIRLLESKSANFCICADTYKQNPICSVSYESYCLLFRAYAKYCVERYQESLELTLDAYDGFRTKSQPIDQALTLWAIALAQIKLGQFNFAKNKLENAIDTLNENDRKLRSLGRYQKIAQIKRINVQIDELLTAINNREKKAYRPFAKGQLRHTHKQSDPKRTKTPFPWKSSQLLFPVYNYVRAGKEGNFIFDSQPEIDATIEEMLFNEKPFRIYNSREEGLPIKIIPAVYRWLRVEGDSMDQAEPIPILDGDYVLCIEVHSSSYSAKHNDIVVVAIRDPSETDRAGVIKKYTKKGLCSVSSQSYQIIPLNKVDIRGVVIAVAKPITQGN
jgi:hypothetical protein